MDARWFTPQAALDAHGEGEILLVFPTIKHLEQVGRFATADALLGYAAGRDVVAVLPKVIVAGESARIVLPGRTRIRRLTRPPSAPRRCGVH